MPPYSYIGSGGGGAISLGVADTKSLFDDFRQDILDGIVGSLSTSTSWNSVRGSIPVTAVVRTSDTVVTITLADPIAAYDISGTEVLTVNVNNRVLASKHALVGSPTVSITGTTAYSYAGCAGVGALTAGSGVQKARAKSPVASVAYSLGSSVSKSRGKAPVVGGAVALQAGTFATNARAYSYGSQAAYALQHASERARGKAPALGAGWSLQAGADYSNVVLYVYTGDSAMVFSALGEYSETEAGAGGTANEYTGTGLLSFQSGAEYVPGEWSDWSDSEDFTTESYPSGGTIVLDAGSVCSRNSNYTYVGQGVLAYADGTEHAIGRVYTGGGAYHFQSGVVIARAVSVSHDYVGTGEIVQVCGTLYSSNTSDAFSYESAGSFALQSAYQRIVGRVWDSSSAAYAWNGGAGTVVDFSTSPRADLEAKPSLRTTSRESVPTRPAGQDGAWTEPGQDGAWTEEPSQGAYTDIGYFKEFKPFNRYGGTKEDRPT